MTKQSFGEISEFERASARTMSFTSQAILVFFLYMLFYIPGLAVNYMYFQEAKRMEYLAGRSLPGTGYFKQ